jgi:hypothetical protein
MEARFLLVHFIREIAPYPWKSTASPDFPISDWWNLKE